MSTHPSRLLPYYLIGVLLILSVSGFCSGVELSEFQKQARLYRIQGYALQQEDLGAALSYYQKALALDPRYEVAYNDLGVIFEALGDKEYAKEMYLKAIQISRDYPSSYSNLALLYEGEEDYAKAIYYWGMRASLGYLFEPWFKEARKHIEEISRLYPEMARYLPEQYKQKVLEPARIQGMIVEEIELQNKIQELRREIDEVDLKIKKESGNILPETKKIVEAKAKPGPPQPVLAIPKEPLEEARLQNRIKELKKEISRINSEIEKESKEVILESPSLPETKAPEKPRLVSAPLIPDKKKQDNKTRALDYLASAKENFSRGQYVSALKEATVAGYLDPSNEEISAFVEKVRKTLLQ